MRGTAQSVGISPLILFVALDGDEIQLFAAATLTSPKAPVYPLSRRGCGGCVRRFWGCDKGKHFHHLAAKLWSPSRPVTFNKIYVNSGQISLVEAVKNLTCVRKMSVLNFSWDIVCLSEVFIYSIQSTFSRFNCSHPFQLNICYYPITWAYMFVFQLIYNIIIYFVLSFFFPLLHSLPNFISVKTLHLARHTRNSSSVGTISNMQLPLYCYWRS